MNYIETIANHMIDYYTIPLVFWVVSWGTVCLSII